MSSNILEAKALTKTYPGRSMPVLKDINFSVKKGEFLCLTGPSGCGKTTLIRCIAGFEDFEGEITVNCRRRNKPGTDRIMVFQDFNQLFPWKTVLQNVDFNLKQSGIKDRRERLRICREYLSMVEMWDYRDYYPHQLSGGMKQRVAIAKSLSLRPDILLMDEPFASLDGLTRRKLHNELISIYEKENLTVIFITHNVQECLLLGTRIMIMRSGGIRLDMTNDLERPVTPATEHYGEYWEKIKNAIEGK